MKNNTKNNGNQLVGKFYYEMRPIAQKYIMEVLTGEWKKTEVVEWFNDKGYLYRPKGESRRTAITPRNLNQFLYLMIEVVPTKVKTVKGTTIYTLNIEFGDIK